MTDVVDQVARAIYPDFDDEPAWAAIRDARRRAARAAMTAFLAATREPSEAMLEAGRKDEPFTGPYAGWTPGQIIASTVWRAMHAALAREFSE